MPMKPLDDWPIDPRYGHAEVGDYLIVLDHNHDGTTTFRIHLRVERDDPHGVKWQTYDFIDPNTLEICDYEYERNIWEGTPAYTKLESVMNLLGTRQAMGYCPAFTATEAELRTILGMDNGRGES